MDLSNILVISGKSDLSELVSQTKAGAIVKNLVSGQKYPVFKNDRISSLAEIRIFTNTSETPLEEVMQNIYNKQNGTSIDFDPKKADSDTLFGFFATVLPEYDKERVHASDVKKVLSWYNILLAAEKLTPTAEEKKSNEEKPVEINKSTNQQINKSTKVPAAKTSVKAKAAPKRTTTAKKAI